MISALGGRDSNRLLSMGCITVLSSSKPAPNPTPMAMSAQNPCRLNPRDCRPSRHTTICRNSSQKIMLPPNSNGPRKNSLSPGTSSLTRCIQTVSASIGMMAAIAATIWTVVFFCDDCVVMVFM